MFSFFFNLFSAYELESGQQLTGVPVSLANGEPGQAWGGSEGGLAHAAAHELIGTLEMQNTWPQFSHSIFLCVTEAQGQLLNTYVCVRVIEFHHNVGRSSHCHLWVAENLHLVEDERLIPGGIEGVTYGHSFLRLVEE